MPLSTNPQWELENAQLVKRPLYVLVIENLAGWLTTFRPEDAEVTWGGYGVWGYGTLGYGY
jgi:hypothetical protein